MNESKLILFGRLITTNLITTTRIRGTTEFPILIYFGRSVIVHCLVPFTYEIGDSLIADADMALREFFLASCADCENADPQELQVGDIFLVVRRAPRDASICFRACLC